MLLSKLAELANHLDTQGHYAEAMQIDDIIKFIVAGAQCACDCPECKNEKPHKCECNACVSDGACACG